MRSHAYTVSITTNDGCIVKLTVFEYNYTCSEPVLRVRAHAMDVEVRIEGRKIKHNTLQYFRVLLVFSLQRSAIVSRRSRRSEPVKFLPQLPSVRLLWL